MARSRLFWPTLLVVVLAGAWTVSVDAHHSYAMFDQGKVLIVQGTIARVEWVDPHVWVWAYVRNDKGEYDLYGFETGSISALARQGWTTTTLKTGDKVSIEYNPLRDGRKGGYFRSATFEDGKKTPGQG